MLLGIEITYPRGVGTAGACGAGAPLKFRASICDLQMPGNARNYMYARTQRAHDGAPP